MVNLVSNFTILNLISPLNYSIYQLRSLNDTRSIFHNRDDNKKAHNKNNKRLLTALWASLTVSSSL